MMDEGLIVDDLETELFFSSKDNIRKTSFLGQQH